MSILSELQSRKLGLVEIIVFGYEIYFKNIKFFLIQFCVLILPWATMLQILQQYRDFVLFTQLCVWFYLLIVIAIYAMSLVIATENLVLNKETRFKSLMSQIFPNIGTAINLNFKFTIGLILRLFLLIVPGIIYGINNGYVLYTFALRGQKGKAAFNYSRTIVKGNWWRVFFFSLLTTFSVFGLQLILQKILKIIPFLNSLSVSLLSTLIPQFILLGMGIAGVLLFLNLDYQKSLEP
ncbi:hypothetical protein IQ226_22595 [Dolichospermum sp. LEGE 00240]|uniref:hypothetical protein n=1 Tax=Dolichospermum sp. LEGE 00240 TaxID=1828603 RepID=UPI00187F6BF8|nr:hypothetical protein [Dolichospermum sp. LEGE 00240]MBE9251841.1 hypothetical protein [Dolichospermum sp. LEGE 00240]MDM3847390.1 hypothetical protein [Aphanizomenon gracile PMC638.10]